MHYILQHFQNITLTQKNKYGRFPSAVFKLMMFQGLNQIIASLTGEIK